MFTSFDAGVGAGRPIGCGHAGAVLGAVSYWNRAASAGIRERQLRHF